MCIIKEWLIALIFVENRITVKIKNSFKLILNLIIYKCNYFYINLKSIEEERKLGFNLLYVLVFGKLKSYLFIFFYEKFTSNLRGNKKIMVITKR